jgi:hypothetical protein
MEFQRTEFGRDAAPIQGADAPRSPAAPAPSPDVVLFNFSVASLISLMLHTSLMIWCASVALRGPAGGKPDGEEEVLLTTLAQEELQTQPAEMLEPLPPNDARKGKLDESLDAMEEIRLAGGDSAGGGDGEVLLAALAPSGADDDAAAYDINVAGGASAMDGQAVFMGAQAQGRRFCIIADRSGSMLGTKFDQLRHEVIDTLDDMRSFTRVQIVLFSDKAYPFPKTEWLNPRQDRAAVKAWLDSITADGDTNPMPAFAQAFKLQPLPDAIFFMTDGEFDTAAIQHIRRLNNDAAQRVPIHTITFIDRGAEAMMKTIAADSGGTYRHVSVLLKLPWK